MKNVRILKKKTMEIIQLWEKQSYQHALSETETLREAYPGNPKLLVMWANLVQLQEETSHTLEDVKKTLKAAVELDDDNPSAAVELGHFLDSVEDDPKSAARVFSKAATRARHLLVEALLGQAKSLLQLGKRSDALNCIAEAIQLADSDGDKTEVSKKRPSVLVVNGQSAIASTQLRGPYAGEIENLLMEMRFSKV